MIPFTQPATRPSKWHAAAVCWIVLLAAGKLGGPLGVMKLLYCEYPFSHATNIGFYPEPGATPSEIDRYNRWVKSAETKVGYATFLTWSGLAVYLLAIGLCVFFIVRRHPDAWLIYLILLVAAAFLWYAISEREVPFYAFNGLAQPVA